MWRKKKTESGPSLLNRLINELLSMILYEVLLLDGKGGLLSLSPVSIDVMKSLVCILILRTLLP